MTSEKISLKVDQKGLTNMTGITKLLENVFAPITMVQTRGISNTNSNPFANYSGNPFVSTSGQNPFADYGQNKPVAGGYFAGYYNNQPNIVGRRLFIEV